MKPNQITIFGGTFNPFHNGHLEIVKNIHDKLNIENIILLPNKTTYYKKCLEIVSDDDRIAMLKAVAEDTDFLSVSDIEIRRGGVTHTIDTVRSIYSNFPESKVSFIIGGDSLLHLPEWVDSYELFDRVHFITVIRGNIDTDKSVYLIKKYKENYSASIDLFSMPFIDISSSMIRDKIKNGESIDELVPDKVRDYIEAKGLYRGEKYNR